MLATMTIPLLWSVSAIAKSTDLKALENAYPTRHFEEIQLPSGITHFQSVGSGPVVILVHGTNGSMAVWDKNLDPLVAAGYRVIRYDLYGRGFSSRLENGQYDLETYENQLEELIKALNLGSHLRLIGNSLGAIIVTEFALRHPRNVDGLILVGPAGFPINTPPLARLGDIPVIGNVFTYFLAYRTILQQDDDYFVSKKMPQELRAYVADQLSVPGTTDAILKTLKNSPLQSYVDSYQKLGKAAIPVGLIWGREDNTFPYDNSSVLLEAVPQARLVTVEDAGHVPEYERPERVTPSLIEFEKRFP
jgi:pimeloyl-ACP methyl ester carboxylesterase